MPDYKLVACEQNGSVLTITLNNPETLNALSPLLEGELHSALEYADSEESVRAVILTGAGRAFSSGYNISRGENIDSADSNDIPQRSSWRSALRNPDMIMHIMQLSKPIIAAVNGWCIGGGFWYSLACDITIASDKAVFGQPEVRMVSNSSVLFALLCGWKNAHRYTLTGDHFDAEEALRIGVVNQVVPLDELIPTSNKLAHRLALVPRDSVKLNKMMTTYALEAMGLRNALNVNSFLSTIVQRLGDKTDVEHLEKARQEGGFRAFLEARDAPFLPEPFGPRSKP
jgi:enoyl-CoA hydratase/carnithine racemase